MPPKKATDGAALAAETDIEGLDPEDVLEDEILAEFAGEPSPAEEDEPAAETDSTEPVGEEGVPEPEVKIEEPKEVAEPAAAEGEPVEAVEAEPKAKEPAPEPAAPPAVEAPVQQPEPASAPTLTAEQVQEAYATQREEAIERLAKEHYALPSETVEALTETLGEDFVTSIPRMLSRVYVDAVSASMQRTLALLPQAIASVMETRTQSDKSEVAFYAKWPGLREHHPKVVQFAQAYRAVNPAASEDDFIQDVGAQVSVAMRIPIEGAAPAAVPAATPASKPFVPGKGGATKPAAQPGTENQFEELANEIIEEDKVA